jgi:glutathione transport system substrate-binding protein
MTSIRTLAATLLAALLMAVPSALAQDDGEVVYVAQQLAHSSLNPAEATGLADASVIRTMFEGLVGFDRDFELVPELAESWTIAPDATWMEFQIREGVTFHDGTDVDAQAIADYYAWVLDEDNPEPARGRSLLSDVETIEVLGPYELRIELAQPNGAMIFNLALSNARIASPASVTAEGADVTREPVGTGPYRFQEWLDGQKVVVEANPDYWGEPAGADEIHFLATTNASTRAAQLRSGEAHFIEAVPQPLVEQIDAADGLSVVLSGSTFARVFELNTQAAPFDDVRVRQAMNLAIDKDVVVQVAYGGNATVMNAPIPRSVFGHAAQGPYPYDPERARELLAEAGHEDGFAFDVLTFTGEPYATIGQVMQQMFADVGLTMNLRPTERGALVDAIFQPIESTELEASLVGASTPTGDADRALTVSFYSESWPPNSNNWSFYANDRVDELIEAGRGTGDLDERAELYAEAQEIIWNDAPWVFLVSPDNVAGKADELSGVFYMPDRSIDARGATLD